MQIRKYRFFYKNKNGQIKISLTELLGAILAVAFIALIVYVGLRLSGILISSKDYRSSAISFELLGERIDKLIDGKNYANTNMLYFLDPNFILVGFNYKDPSVPIKTCEKGFIFKDAESLVESRRKIGSLCEGACLCLYKDTNGDDFDDEQQLPLDCKSFDENVVFLAPAEQDVFCGSEIGWYPKAYKDYYQTGNYKFLIAYGFNTKEIYIDRYKSEDDNVFIFIAEYKDDPNDPIYKRKRFMEERYEKAS